MPGADFPRAARLLASADFKRVFAGAVRSTDGWLTVLGCRNEGCRARLGMAISRKAIGRAVCRNRIKRLIRESFRHHQPSLVGLDVVVMARRQAGAASNADLLDGLERHWARLRAKSCREP